VLAVRRVLLICGLLASAAYAGAADKVDRWVDAAGVTHFDARPPADGQQSEEVLVRGERRLKPELVQQDAPAAEVVADPVDEKLSAMDGDICERARESLRVLQQEKVVVRQDKQSGERRVLSAAERAEAVVTAEAEVKRVCGSEPAR